MADFLDVLGQEARERVKADYYEAATMAAASTTSIREAVLKCRNAPIIAEIKAASPSLGLIRKNLDVEEVALALEGGGAAGISVLTEPRRFGGSLDAFVKVRTRVKLPLLMKDIIVSPVQIEAAAKMGADAVLLIEPLFGRGYCECDLNSMIAYAHSKGLEVLLEAHTHEEFSSTLKTEADLVGVNNRDLKTLEVDLKVTKRILAKNQVKERLVVSESGIHSPADIRFLHECGAHAFLVGSSIMRADDIRGKVKELVSAL